MRMVTLSAGDRITNTVCLFVLGKNWVGMSATAFHLSLAMFR